VLVTSCSIEGSEERTRERNPYEEDESKQGWIHRIHGGGGDLMVAEWKVTNPSGSSSSSGALELLDSKRGKQKASSSSSGLMQASNKQ
jgi:hypothetical protein